MKKEDVERMLRAAEDITIERGRQFEIENWSTEHDDEHSNGELAFAAGAYAIAHDLPNRAEMLWPWDVKWWKPTDRRRNLVKAGALIVAEIERLDRANSPKETVRAELGNGGNIGSTASNAVFDSLISRFRR